MAATFVEAAAALTEDERQVLFSSIPRLVAAVATADGFSSEDEVARGVDGLIAVVDELGEEFRHSPHAEVAFDGLADALDAGDPGFAAYLVRLRRVVAKLPPDHAERYRAFVARLCVDIAKASRKYILWGRRIHETEARVLASLVAALELEIDDPDVRALLGGSDA